MPLRPPRPSRRSCPAARSPLRHGVEERARPVPELNARPREICLPTVWGVVTHAWKLQNSSSAARLRRGRRTRLRSPRRCHRPAAPSRGGGAPQSRGRGPRSPLPPLPPPPCPPRRLRSPSPRPSRTRVRPRCVVSGAAAVISSARAQPCLRSPRSCALSRSRGLVHRSSPPSSSARARPCRPPRPCLRLPQPLLRTQYCGLVHLVHRRRLIRRRGPMPLSAAAVSSVTQLNSPSWLTINLPPNFLTGY